MFDIGHLAWTPPGPVPGAGPRRLPASPGMDGRCMDRVRHPLPPRKLLVQRNLRKYAPGAGWRRPAMTPTSGILAKKPELSDFGEHCPARQHRRSDEEGGTETDTETDTETGTETGTETPNRKCCRLNLPQVRSSCSAQKYGTPWAGRVCLISCKMCAE